MPRVGCATQSPYQGGEANQRDCKLREYLQYSRPL
jgi:hypothetical protein